MDPHKTQLFRHRSCASGVPSQQSSRRGTPRYLLRQVPSLPPQRPIRAEQNGTKGKQYSFVCGEHRRFLIADSYYKKGEQSFSSLSHCLSILETGTAACALAKKETLSTEILTLSTFPNHFFKLTIVAHHSIFSTRLATRQSVHLRSLVA